jgi:TolB-like protein
MPAAAPAARHSTLGSVALVVTAMVAVVSITLGGVAWMGRKHAPAAVAATSAKPALAIMTFENATGDSRLNWYGENTSELLRVVLAQLDNVSVISKQRLFDVLREMKVEGDASDPRVATEVAKKSGAAYVIRGNALMVGGSVVLTAEVVNVADGTVIGAERVTGVDEENMLDKVDELGRLLSERLKVIR